MSELFRIIELRDYDVKVPFICHNCGSCCKEYTPPIYSHVMPVIAAHLGIPLDALKGRHERAYLSRNTSAPEDCPYLTEQNKCFIYHLRPEGCRNYPFAEFGASGAQCPGYKELYNIIDALFKDQVYAAMHDPEFMHDREIRSIPEGELPGVLSILRNTCPSDRVTLKFHEMNNIPHENST
jgi:Fe-S-cluster containining protein